MDVPAYDEMSLEELADAGHGLYRLQEESPRLYDLVDERFDYSLSEEIESWYPQLKDMVEEDNVPQTDVKWHVAIAPTFGYDSLRERLLLKDYLDGVLDDYHTWFDEVRDRLEMGLVETYARRMIAKPRDTLHRLVRHGKEYLDRTVKHWF